MDLAMVVYGKKEYESCDELQHHSHDHPLTLLKDINYVCQRCRICQFLLGSGWVYCCTLCYNYSIHKLCATFPKTLRSWLHPEHRLELLYSPPGNRYCHGCMNNAFGLGYSCKLCNFDVDMRCALSYVFKESQGHNEHSFVLLKPTFFICDGCGVDEKEVKRFSWVCTVCQLQAHKSCSYAFRSTIRLQQHCHKLKATYQFQVDFDMTKKICRLCFNKMNGVFFMYYCSDCSYVAHAYCAAQQDLASDDEDNSDDSDDQKVAIRSVEIIEPKELVLEQVKHFKHPHCLIVGEYDSRLLEEVCDGCARQITPPFYTCGESSKCNFYLHKHCFELERNIQHPLHAHPLTLISFMDSQWRTEVGFVCYGCHAFCNGFAYICEDCEFFLDVGCSLLSDTLVHEAHGCTLTLIDMSKQQNYPSAIYPKKTLSTDSSGKKCNGCNSECSCKYLCDECNFGLDLYCASLPKTILHECPKYKWAIGPQNLMYGAIKDASGVYYCDTCEELRGENDWYYYCDDCNYSTHSQCVFGSNLIKDGMGFKIFGHDHHVISVKKPRRDRSCCACKESMKDYPALYCAKCDVYFHVKCCIVFSSF